jgi:protein-S-isoprenylcysteine O-methyltransferase Ste14
MPVTREEKIGDEAWKQCARLRSISFLFASVMVINTFLWIWFPIPELAWLVYPNPLVGIVFGIIIGIPCLYIMVLALRDAGEEMHTPLKETTLHGGIYRRVRHPGAVGEMPLYVVIALFTNSLFMTIWMLTLIVLFTPIHVYYEEKDLLKRFGE